ncbi:ATP-binding protein [Clostridium drakei]|uniref:DNA replication protein n=1 Tax=Clostridium drakei TaxID=332101 RepID=A0A2U8DZP3_9CLOT|nr:ATP-binding protein [Clostridium drakei]AWI07742.1 DNA replication protein [Clostridium drakei]
MKERKQKQSGIKETWKDSSEANALENCPICGGKGYIIKHSPDAQDTIAFCKCREMDKLKRMWSFSGIETQKNKLIFKNYKVYNTATEEAKNTALKYFKSFKQIRNTRKNSIAFLGQVGSGKSHLSIAIGLNLLSKGIPVIYMSYREQIIKLKQNILDEEYYEACTRKFKTAQVLIIDDLYKGKLTDSDINITFEIINYRYMKNLPIIISSEFTVEKLLYFDESIGSRILEMCKNFIVEIHGKENNYRLR